MSAAAANDAARLSESYLAWWRDAGVDMLVDAENHNWLESLPKPDAPLDQPTPKTEKPAITVRAQPQQESAPDTLHRETWPKDIDALTKMLTEKAALPGNAYGGRAAIPSVSATPKAMLIGDLPDPQDLDNGDFTSGSCGQLAQRMAGAIGYSADELILTALATTRPAVGVLAEGDLALLADFMNHQIGLFRPEKVVIFGSAACQALLGADMMDMRGCLHYFNHNVHKVVAVTTFHPRTLLTRPQMKRQAWRDLQVLIK